MYSLDLRYPTLIRDLAVEFHRGLFVPALRFHGVPDYILTLAMTRSGPGRSWGHYRFRSAPSR